MLRNAMGFTEGNDMDADESGSLSLDEMLKGYDNIEAFSKLMQIMDIRREDMETIFHVLDSDLSGEVSYFEFCQHLSGFFERDPTIMQSLIKCFGISSEATKCKVKVCQSPSCVDVFAVQYCYAGPRRMILPKW